MNGFEDYLKTEDSWVHLRLYRQFGRIGCCDNSKYRHATKHYRATGHPIMEPYNLLDQSGWWYSDEEMFDFIGNQTIHVEASSRCFLDRKPQ
jgi:Zn-finger in ubiquitin-hydrolases and other protein